MIDPRELWDFDDASASGERFLDAAEGASEPDRTSWLTQYARALGLLERYDEATKVLDRLHAGAPEAATYLALERGRVLHSSGRAEESRPHFESAVAVAQGAGLEALEVDARHMVALAAPPEEQLALNEAALAVARAATDPRARDWDASLLNNIGMTYAGAGDFEAALTAFERALAARERIGDPGGIRVAQWMIGWTYRNLGRRDEARAIQLALKRELDAGGHGDEYVDEELALLAD
ncbi:MAG TPA: tetratricopeptide repeat protein [Nocardioides sp.]|uniref:tetratricopeptide repeat protein n=1 Tax=Nocardioides sp. TaxID=35761 RepID=UPI002E321FA3|nr:tetratricopeptide repeat protein [Nocardioides sp.]HEX3930056.1 tetratricopeptide repeat protein [Nocardioides sp.]